MVSFKTISKIVYQNNYYPYYNFFKILWYAARFPRIHIILSYYLIEGNKNQVEELTTDGAGVGAAGVGEEPKVGAATVSAR